MPRDGYTTTSSVGAASELRACAELMRLGYYVYRCESPHAPFDLVAYKDGQCKRVEVKTMTEPRGGQAPGFPLPTNDEWDLLLIVAEDQIFIFESGLTMPKVRDLVRAAYGFPPCRTEADLVPCGTWGAYLRHRRREEKICDPCRTFIRDQGRKRLARKANASAGTAQEATEPPDAYPSEGGATPSPQKPAQEADR